jgi:hypothetical protein
MAYLNRAIKLDQFVCDFLLKRMVLIPISWCKVIQSIEMRFDCIPI